MWSPTSHLSCNRYVVWLAVQSLMERSVVLGMGARQETASPALAELLSQYASILASQVASPDSGTRACHPLMPFTFWPQSALHLT